MRSIVLWAAALALAFDAMAGVEIKYTGSELRDPFSEKVVERVDDSAQQAEQRIRSMVVQGMLISSSNPQAIINGKIYRVGSSIDAGKITAIDKTGVTVSWDGRQIFIPHLKKGASHEKTKPSAH